MKVPFFRLHLGNKTSYLLGTNHWYPNFPDQIKNIILNQQNLISEIGFPKLSLKHNSSYYFEWNSPLFNYKYADSRSFFNIEKHLRYFYNPNIVDMINSNELNTILSKQLECITTNINDVNSRFVIRLVINMLYFNGLDHKLMNYYKINNKKLYRLDPDDKEYNDIITLYFEEFEKKFKKILYMYVIERKIINKQFGEYLKDIVNLNTKDYFTKDFNYLKQEINSTNNEYIIGKRNDIWVPKIIKYHNELDKPLFMVGYGHLYGEYDLFKKLKNKESSLNLEIYNLDRYGFEKYL